MDPGPWTNRSDPPSPPVIADARGDACMAVHFLPLPKEVRIDARRPCPVDGRLDVPAETAVVSFEFLLGDHEFLPPDFDVASTMAFIEDVELVDAGPPGVSVKG